MTIKVMSLGCKDFLKAVLKRNWRNAYFQAARLDASELFRAYALPDRKDLDEFWKNQSQGSGDPEVAKKLADLEYAYNTVKNGKKPKNLPADASIQPPAVPGPPTVGALALPATSAVAKATAAKAVNGSGGKHAHGHGKGAAKPTGVMSKLELGATHYLAEVVAHRRMPLLFDADVTGTLPGGGSPPSATDKDFTAAAKTLSVEVNAIKSVFNVEVKDTGSFDSQGRPTIRYELHIFEGFTNAAYHKTHPWLSQPSLDASNRYHVWGSQRQNREFSMMFNAMMLRGQIDNALKSTSWGGFQVMGENFADGGWKDVVSFANDMFVSESNHMKIFTGFIDNHSSIKTALQKHQWATFAAGYNGGGYKANQYDTKMETEFDALEAADKKKKQQAAPQGAHHKGAHVPTGGGQ